MQEQMQRVNHQQLYNKYASKDLFRREENDF